MVTGLQAQPGLARDPSSPPGGWTIKRAGIAYSVKVSVCSMDDPTDGYGDHAVGGPYCADVPAAGIADSDADDFKRVIVDVSWTGTRRAGSTRAVTLISSAGLNGPSVTCLRPTGSTCPSAPAITSSAQTSINFTATFKGTATRVDWYVNGSRAGTATLGTGTATFTWTLGTTGSSTAVADGSYEISAIAFDANGMTGTVGSVQVSLNRQAPSIPGGYLAGRDDVIGGNGTIGGVDLDWLPVPDGDVLSYRVYRQAGTSTPTLLATVDPSQTAYTDLTPAANPTDWYTSPTNKKSCSLPLASAPSTLKYWVVAVDQNGASLREGTPTAKIDVNLCNHAPKPLTGLTLTQNPDGTILLDGTVPTSSPDPDSGDTINALRLYRWTGSTLPPNPGARLDYGFATAFTGFTDPSPRPGGVAQKYCVTTVDLYMQESPCSNVVTG